MPTIRALFVLSLSPLLLIAAPVQADQQHIVAPSQLAATVTNRVAQQDADRATIAEALARPEVRRAAEAMGADMSRVDAAAHTLAGADLERAAQAARDVNDVLAGGASSITIGTTTLIIILLLVILIIVAVK